MYSRTRFKLLTLGAAALLSGAGVYVGGCSHDETRADVSLPRSELSVAPAPAPPDKALATCGIPKTPQASPQFDFDDAELRVRGQDILDKLATCLREGPMKGESVTIVGHTDSRGSSRYNLSLGMKRANAAKDYLVARGVSVAAITVSSRGERDAAGDSSTGWQFDRRVEIHEDVHSSR